MLYQLISVLHNNKRPFLLCRTSETVVIQYFKLGLVVSTQLWVGIVRLRYSNLGYLVDVNYLTLG